MGNRRRLIQVNRAVTECRRCPRLVEWREQVASERRAAFADWDYWGRPVPGFGDPDAGVLIVGLAPAAHGANRTGRMFTGDRSGDVLFASLHRTGFANQANSVGRHDGLELSGAWITAPIRCAPPNNKPTPAERDACSDWFAADVELVPWRVAVCLGAYGYQALSALIGLRPRPRFGHGVESAVEWSGTSRHVLCSYHVSKQNTFTGRLTPAMLDDVMERARQLSSNAL